MNMTGWIKNNINNFRSLIYIQVPEEQKIVKHFFQVLLLKAKMDELWSLTYCAYGEGGVYDCNQPPGADWIALANFHKFIHCDLYKNILLLETKQY